MNFKLIFNLYLGGGGGEVGVMELGAPSQVSIPVM